jgi:hypothetical protein
MPKESGFRILGEILDREESYLDVTVDGVSETGQIYLTEGGTDGEVWSFSADRIAELYENLLLVGEGEIPFLDHQIWTDLDNIGQTRQNVDINNSVDDYLRLSQENFFKAIIEAGR